MSNNIDINRPSIILEDINNVGWQRAAVMQTTAFADWLGAFRQKYIVDGFLSPVSAIGGYINTSPEVTKLLLSSSNPEYFIAVADKTH
jgi:hypothetical protein